MMVLSIGRIGTAWTRLSRNRSNVFLTGTRVVSGWKLAGHNTGNDGEGDDHGNINGNERWRYALIAGATATGIYLISA